MSTSPIHVTTRSDALIFTEPLLTIYRAHESGFNGLMLWVIWEISECRDSEKRSKIIEVGPINTLM